MLAQDAAPVAHGDLTESSARTETAHTDAASTDAVPTHTTVTANEAPTTTVPIILPVQHPRVWIMLTIVLAVLLVAAIVVIGYLWNVNSRWQEDATGLTKAGYELGERVAAHREQIAQLESANQLLTDQLATAKDRVLALSNEKAQYGDDAAYAEQQVELLSGRLTDAATVTNQMNRCIEGEQQLVTYLQAEEGTYTPEEITGFATSVDTLCSQAIDAKNAFLQAINP